MNSAKENLAIMQAEELVDRLRDKLEFANPLHCAEVRRELARAEDELAELKSPWTDGRAG